MFNLCTNQSTKRPQVYTQGNHLAQQACPIMNPQANQSNFYADAFAQSNNSKLYTNSQQNRQILHVYPDTN